MSTVKTTNLQHPSSGSVNVQLGSDGSVVLPSGFTGGIGSNVVQTVKTDTFGTTSTSYVDVTGLTATLTPSNATAKILCIADVAYGVDIPNSSQGAMNLRLNGSGTENYVGDADGSRTRSAARQYSLTVSGFATDTDYQVRRATLVYLISPATTSPVAVAVQALTTAGTAYINRPGFDEDLARNSRLASSITLIEVAA